MSREGRNNNQSSGESNEQTAQKVWREDEFARLYDWTEEKASLTDAARLYPNNTVPTETAKKMRMNEFTANFPKANKAFEVARQEENKVNLEIESPILGRATVRTIEVNIVPEEKRHNQKTIYIMGGSVTPGENFYVMSGAFAALGYRVVCLPHALSQEVQYDEINNKTDANKPKSRGKAIDEHFEKFYEYDKESSQGRFSADAEILHRAILADFEAQAEKGNPVTEAHFVGYSAGAAVLMQTAARLEEYPEVKDQCKGLHMLSPAGCFSPDQAKGFSRIGRVARVVGVMAGDGLYAQLQNATGVDRTEWLIQMEAIGENGFYRPSDMFVALPNRCVSDGLFRVAPNLDMQVTIGVGSNDGVFPAETIKQNATEVSEMRENQGKSQIQVYDSRDITLPGFAPVTHGHGWATQGNLPVAAYLDEQIGGSGVSMATYIET